MREAENKERDDRILEMYLACYTQEEIAKAVGLKQNSVSVALTRIKNKQLLEIDIPSSLQFFNLWHFQGHQDSRNRGGVPGRRRAHEEELPELVRDRRRLEDLDEDRNVRRFATARGFLTAIRAGRVPWIGVKKAGASSEGPFARFRTPAAVTFRPYLVRDGPGMPIAPFPPGMCSGRPRDRLFRANSSGRPVGSQSCRADRGAGGRARLGSRPRPGELAKGQGEVCH